MQAVYNIAEICARHGITDVVLSPGSRSAPLTLAFARHPAFRGRVKVVPDERAAAFIGLGIAQATGRPVVLVCTSGTAGLNYAPAVAEAFFQQIPLLILTADRPPEWIDQLDGQTIRQHNLYGVHAKGSFDFPADTTHPDAKWHSERIINEAINLSKAPPFGPVHINVPLREPFYPKAGEKIIFDPNIKIIEQTFHSHYFYDTPLYFDLEKFERVLFVIGQPPYGGPNYVQDAIPQEAIEMSETGSVATVADAIGQAPGALGHHDVFLSQPRSELAPDLLVTCGQAILSKALKMQLRKFPPKEHWHIMPEGAAAAPDLYKALTRVKRGEPFLLYAALLHHYEQVKPSETARKFAQSWQRMEAQSVAFLADFFAQPHSFNEFSAFHQTLNSLTKNTALHLANSMAVRYANILGIPAGKQIEVFANRGTSGIDGCTSTAVGAALAQPERPVVLLTGDVAFFYDRNAFWHNYPTPNLRVVLFNNHGGGIFRLIDGPRQQPELDEFFETRQTLTAENTARDFNLAYFPVSSFAELATALPIFFAKETGAAILEIFTDSKTNAAFFEEYRAAVKTAF